MPLVISSSTLKIAGFVHGMPEWEIHLGYECNGFDAAPQPPHQHLPRDGRSDDDYGVFSSIQ